MKLAILAATAVATLATDGWLTASGMNACNTHSRQGPCGDAADHPGFHFVGTIDNVTACEATCTGAPAQNCSIWLYSSGSKHCWWRTDGCEATHSV